MRHARLFRLGLEKHPQEIGQRRIHLDLFAPVLDLREILGLDLHAGLDRRQDAFGNVGPAPLAQEKPRPAKFLDGRGPGRGQFQKRVVLEDPRARHVARLRVILAEPRQFAHHRQETAGLRAGLDAGPGVLWPGDVGLRVGQDRQLLRHPLVAPGPHQFLVEEFVDDAQMGHVGDRIGLLRLAQRAVRPVGEARCLVEAFAGDLAHQRLVADLFAEAADHRGDLRVEQGRRKHLALDKEDLEILARGVEDLDGGLMTEQVVKRFQRQILDQRIDQHGVSGLAGKRKLDQAQLGIIGPFPEKLRIDGDIGLGLGGLAELGEVLGRCYRFHSRPVWRGLIPQVRK